MFFTMIRVAFKNTEPVRSGAKKILNQHQIEIGVVLYFIHYIKDSAKVKSFLHKYQPVQYQAEKRIVSG